MSATIQYIKDMQLLNRGIYPMEQLTVPPTALTANGVVQTTQHKRLNFWISKTPVEGAMRV
jgi:hypothetical protein